MPCRKLSKAVQTELAGANSVAEEVLSTMTTVKSHAAEKSALAAYSYRLKLFYTLQASATSTTGVTLVIRVYLCLCPHVFALL